MKHTARIIAMIALVTVALFTGCKKPDPSIPTRYGTLWLHMHTNIGNSEIALGQSYPSTTFGNRNISITSARYYLSNIIMIDSSDKAVNVPGTVLVIAGTEVYSVGQIPIGNYKSIRFSIGLSSFANHGEPTQYAAGNPLAPQTPSMHFLTTDSGYYFIDVRGNVDTTGAGTPNAAYNCQIGGDAYTISVDMPDHNATMGSNFTVTEGMPTYVHMIADFDVLFHSADWVHNLDINPVRTPTVVANIFQSEGNLFRYEE